MTHYEEIINLQDRKELRDKNYYEKFLEESKNNFKNRHFHHHVFNKDLIFKILEFTGFKVNQYYEHEEDLITLGQIIE